MGQFMQKLRIINKCIRAWSLELKLNVQKGAVSDALMN